MKREVTRRRGERGSALLIVFVLAAFVAIMLYNEMPVAAFEAKRQKEQLLVDRGNEYAHAVKLFYRKNSKQYPPSIEALEGTNRIRYLRKRYVDPFTGKDDWRLLHAAPNGVITDSKTGAGTTGNNAGGFSNTGPGASGLGTFNGPGGQQTAGGVGGPNTPNGNTSANNTNGSTFGGFFSSSNPQINGTDTAVPNVPQRAPAVSAGGGPLEPGGGPADDTSSNAASPTYVPRSRIPTQSDLAANAAGRRTTDTITDDALAGVVPGADGVNTGVAPNQTLNTGVTNNGVPNNPGGNNGPTPGGRAGGFNNSGLNNSGLNNPGFNNNSPFGSNSGLSNNSGFNNNSGFGGVGSNSGVNAGLNTGANSGGVNGGSSSNQLGQLRGGGGIGIAGVASKASGTGIKEINNQDNYALWEFYYDPSKDSMRGTLGVQGGGAQGAQGNSSNGQTPGIGNPAGGFGIGNNNAASNATSGFGGFNSPNTSAAQSTSGFGNSTSPFGNSNTGFGSNNSSSFGNSNTGFGNSNNSFGNRNPQTTQNTSSSPP